MEASPGGVVHNREAGTMLAWRRTLVEKKFDGSRQRKKATTWHEFIRAHQDVLVATDFFTTQV